MATSTKTRLLFCATCNTVDELPHYDGPVDKDTLLEYLIADKHTFPSGLTHVAPLPIGLVDKDSWEKPGYRKAILDEVNKTIAEGGSDGLGGAFYDSRNTFQDDAMLCWKKHNRTVDCGDFHAKNKELIPNTADLRKEAGLSIKAKDRPKIWLCDFCPAGGVVEQKKNAAKGYYDYK